ncbi:MAG: hypothetical protein HOH88_03095 [Flavobacteriales bacterium]|jgi:hypothetical protein|nr:hypothetical protein [Flavobacteriales bacterium]
MKKKIYKSKKLEFILYFSAILHLAGGVMMFSSQENAYLYLKIIYGYNFEMTSQTIYTLKILGLYSTLYSILIFYSIRNIIKYKIIIFTLILMYLIRLLLSIIDFEKTKMLFGASEYSLYLTIFLQFTILIIMVLEFYKISKLKESYFL